MTRLYGSYRHHVTVPALTRQNQIQLDASDHSPDIEFNGCLNLTPVSYYRNCQDFDRGLAREPADTIDWSLISYVDFKLTSRTHQLQLQDLHQVLNNTQPLRVLHLVAETVPMAQVVDLLHSLQFTTAVILDLHLVRSCETSVQHWRHLQSLDLTRFHRVDYHHIISNREALFIDISHTQQLTFYDPSATRAHGGTAHSLRTRS